MKNKMLHRLSSILNSLVRRACGSRVIRLHPKFRWLSFACPIVTANRRRLTSALRPPTSAVSPPEGPPRLRLRKRRLSVDRPM